MSAVAHSGWGKHDCSHSQDVSVQCASYVRLADGNEKKGRVEVYHNGQWGTVCDDHWDINDAHVVCRQLGFFGARSAHGNAVFGQGLDPIWIEGVGCQGGEASLLDCTHAGWGAHNCNHGEDASVVCDY